MTLRTYNYFVPSRLCIDFIVQYTTGLVHAIDGLGHGLMLMPVNGNLMLKLYDETTTKESYQNCILPLAEMRDLMEAEVRLCGRTN